MSTPKHTPGPWEVTGPHSREVITTNPGTYKPCMTNAKVGGYWDEEAQANAALIAAAPVMYEALRMLTSEINLSTLNVRKDFSLMNAHACAVKAILQAEGKLL